MIECYYVNCPFHDDHQRPIELTCGPFCSSEECKATPEQQKQYAALYRERIRQLQAQSQSRGE